MLVVGPWFTHQVGAIPFAFRCRYDLTRSDSESKLNATWCIPAADLGRGVVPGTAMIAMRWCSKSYRRKVRVASSCTILAPRKVVQNVTISEYWEVRKTTCAREVGEMTFSEEGIALQREEGAESSVMDGAILSNSVVTDIEQLYCWGICELGSQL